MIRLHLSDVTLKSIDERVVPHDGADPLCPLMCAASTLSARHPCRAGCDGRPSGVNRSWILGGCGLVRHLAVGHSVADHNGIPAVHDKPRDVPAPTGTTDVRHAKSDVPCAGSLQRCWSGAGPARRSRPGRVRAHVALTVFPSASPPRPRHDRPVLSPSLGGVGGLVRPGAGAVS